MIKTETELRNKIAEFMFDLAASEINSGRTSFLVPRWSESTNDELKDRYRLAAGIAIHVFRETTGMEKDVMNSLTIRMQHKDIDALIEDRADWLVDAIATATQDRRFLRHDPAEDKIATEAIIANAKKAFSHIVEKIGGAP